MKVETRAVHFELSEKSRQYLDLKLERLHYVKDMIVDMIFVFTKEKDFKLECTANFRWGAQAHIEERSFDLDPGIDMLIDRLETKLSKEKEKIQEKGNHHQHREG
jgi:putative sigma-54 modulation protein